MAAMARLAVVVLLLLSLLAVARSRLLEPTAAAAAALAVPDERDPPERTAAAEGSEPKLVAVPLHRLAGPGVFRDVGFSLRLPAHGRRHPCPGFHGQRLAAAVLKARYLIKSKKSEVSGLDSAPDDVEEVGKGWKRARKVMKKRFHHGHRRHHHHAAEEVRGVMKWFRDLMDF